MKFKNYQENLFIPIDNRRKFLYNFNSNALLRGAIFCY